MKIDDVRAMSDAELKAKIQDLKDEALKLRIQQQSGQLERPSRIRDIRRTIAKIETVISERANKEAQAEAATA
ncbi:MAG: 50S ribosomal protein L29 [Verrucomicrobiota bacterium]